MRQNINVDPSQKVFESFLDFSGGLNTEVTNENLKNNEMSTLLNADLSGRGSARLRYGRTSILTQAGTAQGVFFYYRSGQSYPDIILAVGGRLYVKENGSSTATEIPITDGGSPFTFQSSLSVEAVQYKETLYVATGTKLVEVTYDSGWTAQVVVPYTPTVMEAIYIGTNGLAPDPDNYIQNGVSVTANVEAIGIKPQTRFGAINTPIEMTAFVNVPSSYVGTIDYKWEFKKSSDSTYAVQKDFTASESSETFNFVSATDYDIRVTVRKTGDATTPVSTQIYVLVGFTVKAVADNSSSTPVDALSKCRHILLHWDRILLYGDDKYPYQMYISDLSNPRYYPVSNTITFDTGKQEPITAAVRFQNMLVVFTKTTIQTLVGKSGDDYQRFQIHDGIGCIAGRTAQVVGNNIYFLSHEGIQALKPNPYRLETMNVARIDQSVKSEMPTDEDACAIVTDSMYWICFPQKKTIYRYYYESGVWSKDATNKLDIVQFLLYGEDAYNLTVNGNLYMHDYDVYTDAGELYDMVIETKALDLSASFNYKKLKKLYALAKHYNSHNVDFYVTIQADSAVILTPDSGQAVIDENGYVVWQTTTTPNFQFYAGTTFGTWLMGKSPFGEVNISVQKTAIRGKCRRVRFHIRGGNGNQCEFFGFGLEFRLTKP